MTKRGRNARGKGTQLDGKLSMTGRQTVRLVRWLACVKNSCWRAKKC